MTIIVSVSQFRQHIADYIEKAKKGHTVILKDEKKGQQIVQLEVKKKFSPDAFGKALKAASGIFATRNNPEWRKKKDVINWVQRGRKAADRSF